ncbi:MAG: tyrosine recombinase [bacterium]
MSISQKIDYVAQFHAHLLAEKRASKNTFMAYKSDIDQLMAFLQKKNLSIDECKKQHLLLFIKKLYEEKLKSKTVSRKISSIKLFFEYLQSYFALPNCAQGIIFPKCEKNLPSFLSEQEIERLLLAANRDTSLKGFRNKVMLYVLYATGMRVTELVSMTTDQICFDDSFIKLSGKGNKERIVPLPKNILDLLRTYLDVVYLQLVPKDLHDIAKRKNYLFFACYSNDIKALSRQSFWMILKKILICAAIFKNISPHSLRHSLATHLLKNGADIRSLQMLLGHESLSTVQIYTHLENSELRKIYDDKHPRA